MTAVAGGRPLIDRISGDDLMSLLPTTNVPLQVGALLMLDLSSGLEPSRLVAELSQRLPRVPRLRQLLLHVPPGAGRPVWVDDPAFRIEDHVSVLTDTDLSRATVLDAAADLLTTVLPADRPLWAARLLVAPRRDRAALIMVFHHVLADGMAGLAVLGRLVDGAPSASEANYPRPVPSRAELTVDAAAGHWRSIRQLPAALSRLVHAAAELAPTAATHARASSLNHHTGARRRFETVTADVERVRALGHRHGATVNDIALAAITGALARLLAERGEQLPAVVVSIPFSSRTPAGAALGNQSGVIPLLLPTTGDFDQRLAAIARTTATAKLAQRGASTALLAPAFRMLARLGLFGWFINHQRRIHTFVSDLRGPATRRGLVGCPITAIIPLSVATGNITVSFTVLSYAGVLTITINADPQTCPDLDLLRSAVELELAAALGERLGIPAMAT